jgi:sugar transferase (PEP-CTERM/EpsH1 system associated)
LNLLLIASRFPYPLEKGDKLRLYHQIKELSKNHHITLIALNEAHVSTDHLAHLQSFCQQIHIFRLRKWQIAINLLRGFLQGLPLQVSYFYCPSFKKEMQGLIEKYQPEHIYCQLVRMVPYVQHSPYPKTLDYQDAFSVGMQRRAARSSFWLKGLLNLETKRLQKMEQQAFQLFNHCTIISKQDQHLLPFEAKNEVTVVPNGVDTVYFQPNVTTITTYDLVFVGNMGYHPNIIAAKYLVHEILPVLQQTIPHLKLLIAGARPTLEVQQLAGEHIYVSGWMEDIRTAYHSAKVFVAPLFLGSGQQNKILEAMACGLPCITTPQVNNAIGARVNETIFLAETAPDFAAAVVQLLTDGALRRRSGSAARRFVEQHFSWQSATAVLENLLLDVGD